LKQHVNAQQQKKEESVEVPKPEEPKK